MSLEKVTGDVSQLSARPRIALATYNVNASTHHFVMLRPVLIHHLTFFPLTRAAEAKFLDNAGGQGAGSPGSSSGASPSGLPIDLISAGARRVGGPSLRLKRQEQGPGRLPDVGSRLDVRPCCRQGVLKPNVLWQLSLHLIQEHA
jgi:hypothetical protein